MWQKGLFSLVTEKAFLESYVNALTFLCVQFLEDVPVGSYKVRNLVCEGEESVFMI